MKKNRNGTEKIIKNQKEFVELHKKTVDNLEGIVDSQERLINVQEKIISFLEKVTIIFEFIGFILGLLIGRVFIWEFLIRSSIFISLSSFVKNIIPFLGVLLIGILSHIIGEWLRKYIIKIKVKLLSKKCQ